MKASHRASILAVAIVVVLGGCASTQEQAALNKSKLVEDQVYVATVEQIARDRGIAVRWVNPPQKHQDDSDQSPDQTPDKDL